MNFLTKIAVVLLLLLSVWVCTACDDNPYETLTYTDGANSVKVSGVTNVKLIFNATAPVEGAFLDAASEKIFEDKNKGMIA